MVIIRLSRGGRKKRPFYSIVATDSRKRPTSGFIEKIGIYNPLATNKEGETAFRIDNERLNVWLKNGSQMSDTVKQLFKKYKVATHIN